MAIIIDNEKQLFTLHTKNSTYQMKVGLYGVLLHTYYGARVDGQDLSYLIQQSIFYFVFERPFRSFY